MATVTQPQPAAQPTGAVRNEMREITVKNTFVHLSEAPRRAARRCASVPSSARLALGGCSKGAASTDGWTEASTTYGCDSDRESVVSVERAVTEASSTAVDDHASVASEQPSDLEAPPPPPAPPLGAAAKRTPLRSSAAAWTPGVPAAPAPLADGFMFQLSTIIAAALAALAGSGHVSNAMASDGPRGVSIVAQIRPEDVRIRERTLTLVKEALLQAAAASENVYVLGYNAQPFTTTPVGFAAKLAASPPTAEACWDMLSQGACCRGRACRWRHPELLRSLNVMIQVDHSA